MENAEYYRKLVLLLKARLAEMREEKRLVTILLRLYHRQLEELEGKN